MCHVTKVHIEGAVGWSCIVPLVNINEIIKLLCRKWVGKFGLLVTLCIDGGLAYAVRIQEADIAVNTFHRLCIFFSKALESFLIMNFFIDFSTVSY